MAWKAAHVLHPEGSREAETHVRHRAERTLDGNVGQVVKGLRQTATKRNLLSNGWPIASGTVEGTCKNLIRDRFERSGMRWTIETAEALLRPRAAHLSNDFDDYWEHHTRADQQRLYRKDSWQLVLK